MRVDPWSMLMISWANSTEVAMDAHNFSHGPIAPVHARNAAYIRSLT